MASRTKVLVTGGTGAVGRQLCDFLDAENFEVSILSRSDHKHSKYKTYQWDHKFALIDKEAIKTADYIVHLSGAGIADKWWTQSRKKEILQSRTLTTELLYRVLAEEDHHIKGVVSASAVGYYGQITSEKVFKEDDRPGDDFVATVCKAWEAKADKIQELGIRTVKLRLGIVLMKEGGALEKMARPFRWHLGAPLGSGNQKIPWIHYWDLHQIILRAITSQDMSGVYNCCAPEVVSNQHFSEELAKVLGKSMWLPKVPAFVLQLMLGDRSTLLTEGSGVSCDKILRTGFEFRYPFIKEALEDLLD